MIGTTPMKTQVTYRRFLNRQMDLRINRKASMTPAICECNKHEQCPSRFAFNPHSRTAYSTSSAAKTRGSVTHPLGGMEHLQDRVRHRPLMSRLCNIRF